MNVYHYDLCRVAEKLKEKGLEKEGETPLGTMLRLLEEGFPQAGAVSQEQVPAEANCATGLQPLPLKAQALASAIIDLNRHLDGMMKWNEFLKKEITDALDCRRLLVNALANCES